MSNVLAIYTSLAADQSASNQLAKTLIAQKQAKGANVVERDLGLNPIDHLDSTTLGAFFTPAEQRSAEQQQRVAFSDELIQELTQADTLILAVPMYNFGIPSTLKAWIDHIARAGVTFRYTENGPEGLIKNTKAIVVATRGGLYAGTPLDTQTDYLKNVLAFVGITEVEFVYAEGLSMGEDQKANALSAATAKLAELS